MEQTENREKATELVEQMLAGLQTGLSATARLGDAAPQVARTSMIAMALGRNSKDGGQGQQHTAKIFHFAIMSMCGYVMATSAAEGLMQDVAAAGVIHLDTEDHEAFTADMQRIIDSDECEQLVCDFSGAVAKYATEKLPELSEKFQAAIDAAEPAPDFPEVIGEDDE